MQTAPTYTSSPSQNAASHPVERSIPNRRVHNRIVHRLTKLSARRVSLPGAALAHSMKPNATSRMNMVSEVSRSAWGVRGPRGAGKPPAGGIMPCLLMTAAACRRLATTKKLHGVSFSCLDLGREMRQP